VHLAGCLQGRICDVRQLIIDMGSKGSVDPMAGGEESGSNTTAEKAKRSTEPGEGRAKLISALTKHHKYADGSCLNLESVGNNELGRLADVSKASASDFFTLEFGGHTKYKNGYCTDASRLAAVLKQLNGEYSADMLFGGTPPSEKEPDDED